MAALPEVSLFNTLTRRIEPLQPLAPPRVTLYTCGPTVWNFAHIGNFRTFLFEDLLRRWLEHAGYDVFHIMNLTDVDDRTIKAARQAGKKLTEHTAPFTKAFFEDRDYLRIKPAHVYTAATEYMPQMIALVSKLLERGVAYKGEDGSVYFAIQKFPTYGRLSQLDKREIKVGARVASDEYAKGDPSDFALWKKADAEDESVGAAWDAPFGRGRPGWHLECSAMSLSETAKCCGVETLDIHAGGIDLIFPHHENEIAQSEGATGKQFARHWVHGEFLNVKGTKMSKRHGNFLTARDLREQGIDAAAVRLLFFQTHYRQPVDFNDEALAGAAEGVRRLGEFRERLERESQNQNGDEPLRKIAAQLESDIASALSDDLNAPRAVATLFDFVRVANRELDQHGAGARLALQALDRVMQVFEILPTRRQVEASLASWVEERIAARAQARKSKDFKAADAIRAELLAKGIEIEDTPTGTKWKTR
ncbi:MAG TPA: cysteine--tRNA ligase [Gemmatimonadales bacterium]|nr:cysteine--tRNA ligase [Gemmatimonadales bacterium]